MSSTEPSGSFNSEDSEQTSKKRTRSVKNIAKFFQSAFSSSNKANDEDAERPKVTKSWKRSTKSPDFHSTDGNKYGSHLKKSSPPPPVRSKPTFDRNSRRYGERASFRADIIASRSARGETGHGSRESDTDTSLEDILGQFNPNVEDIREEEENETNTVDRSRTFTAATRSSYTDGVPASASTLPTIRPVSAQDTWSSRLSSHGVPSNQQPLNVPEILPSKEELDQADQNYPQPLQLEASGNYHNDERQSREHQLPIMDSLLTSSYTTTASNQHSERDPTRVLAEVEGKIVDKVVKMLIKSTKIKVDGIFMEPGHQTKYSVHLPSAKEAEDLLLLKEISYLRKSKIEFSPYYMLLEEATLPVDLVYNYVAIRRFGEVDAEEEFAELEYFLFTRDVNVELYEYRFEHCFNDILDIYNFHMHHSDVEKLIKTQHFLEAGDDGRREVILTPGVTGRKVKVEIVNPMPTKLVPEHLVSHFGPEGQFKSLVELVDFNGTVAILNMENCSVASRLASIHRHTLHNGAIVQVSPTQETSCQVSPGDTRLGHMQRDKVSNHLNLNGAATRGNNIDPYSQPFRGVSLENHKDQYGVPNDQEIYSPRKPEEEVILKSPNTSTGSSDWAVRSSDHRYYNPSSQLTPKPMYSTGEVHSEPTLGNHPTTDGNRVGTQYADLPNGFHKGNTANNSHYMNIQPNPTVPIFATTILPPPPRSTSDSGRIDAVSKASTFPVQSNSRNEAYNRAPNDLLGTNHRFKRSSYPPDYADDRYLNRSSSYNYTSVYASPEELTRTPVYASPEVLTRTPVYASPEELSNGPQRPRSSVDARPKPSHYDVPRRRGTLPKRSNSRARPRHAATKAPPECESSTRESGSDSESDWYSGRFDANFDVKDQKAKQDVSINDVNIFMTLKRTLKLTLDSSMQLYKIKLRNLKKKMPFTKFWKKIRS